MRTHGHTRENTHSTHSWDAPLRCVTPGRLLWQSEASDFYSQVWSPAPSSGSTDAAEWSPDHSWTSVTQNSYPLRGRRALEQPAWNCNREKCSSLEILDKCPVSLCSATSTQSLCENAAAPQQQARFIQIQQGLTARSDPWLSETRSRSTAVIILREACWSSVGDFISCH